MSPAEVVMWHTLFIIGHAVTGTVSLLAGCLALLHQRWFRTYFAALAGMELFLLAAIGVGWPDFSPGARLLFPALAGLGVAMLVAAELARRCRGVAPTASYVERLGFTLVSLFDAFLVVSVLNTGAPVWLVVTTGVAIAAAGHFAIRHARTRLTRPDPRPAG